MGTTQNTKTSYLGGFCILYKIKCFSFVQTCVRKNTARLEDDLSSFAIPSLAVSVYRSIGQWGGHHEGSRGVVSVDRDEDTNGLIRIAQQE